MSDREKLIELLRGAYKFSDDKCRQAEDCTVCPNRIYGTNCQFAYEVDHLIANGVTVQKHGRWDKYGYKWRCSECGKKINIDGTPRENGLCFCPNCGAKMEGEADG